MERAAFSPPDAVAPSPRTGDLGVSDGARRLRIVGRVKDMFIVGGVNAGPPGIENALPRHPAIRRAAVIGVPHQRLGEVCMPFAVVSEDVSADDIIGWSREQMANDKVPRAVGVVDQLALDATGEVVNETRRARAAAQRTGASA
jgi:HIP---CoA ligase